VCGSKRAFTNGAIGFELPELPADLDIGSRVRPLRILFLESLADSDGTSPGP